MQNRAKALGAVALSAVVVFGLGVLTGRQTGSEGADASPPPVTVAPPVRTVAPLLATAAWPSPTNRGVPAGTVLTAYTGSTTIKSCGVVIDSKIITGDLNVQVGNGTHSASTPCVTLKNSKVTGVIDDGYTSKFNAGPLVVMDTEVGNTNARDVACISDTNYFLFRVYSHGCRSGAQTDGVTEIHDSYLIADTEFGTAHMDAFITNGNYGASILLDHNSFLCAPKGGVPNGAGCAADVGLFADFSAVTNVTMTNNQFIATQDAYYCIHTPYEPGKKYGTQGKNNVFRDNVFQKGASGKCGGANAVYDWNNSAGEWCRNLFDDASKVLPNNTDNCSGTPPTSTTTTTTLPPVTTTTVAPTTTTTKPPVTTTTTKPVTTTTTVPPTTTTTTTPPPVSVPFTVNCRYYPQDGHITCP